MNSFKSANWHIHRADPDNWLRIPEFRVLPEEVNFAGFSLPILGPDATNFYWKVPIHDAVHSVRAEARCRFDTLASLKDCYLKAVNSDEFMFDPFESKPITWTNEQLFAWRYETFFSLIERAITFYRHDKNQAMGQLAYAMCYALDLFGNKPLDAESLKLVRTEIAKTGAQAKVAADPKQSTKSKVHGYWRRWKAQPKLYARQADFVRDMMRMFGPESDLGEKEALKSAEVVARWNRAWNRELSEQSSDLAT